MRLEPNSWLCALKRGYRKVQTEEWSRSLVARIRYGRGVAALADQALVSGSNFATTIVLVRALGLTEFGKYYIAYAAVLYAYSLQLSFITGPMLILAPLLDGEKKEQMLNGMLTMEALVSALLFVVCIALGCGLHFFTNYYSWPCILAISCSVGAYQLQDWIRRYYFVTGRGNLAIVSDFISYFVQLVLLAALAWTKHLTLTSTFWVMALTSAAAFSMGPITDRFHLSVRKLQETWSQCKKLSRDLLVAAQVQWFGGQGILLLGTWVVGVADVGGLQATQSLAGPVNLVLTSLQNVLPIKIAELLKTKGTAAAYLYIRNAILGSTAIFGLILIPVAIFGHSILRIVYGPAVVAFYLPMLLQLVTIVVGLVPRLWGYFYRGLQDTRAILRANALYTIVGLGTLFIFGRIWGPAGVVMASLTGYVVLVAYYAFHWRRYK
ncbi:MAG: lipopolysaccharide biosynthesis protein, partial [Terriglobia bacterium]